MNQKQIRACKLAIDVLTDHRRKFYAVGSSAAVYGLVFGIEQKKRYDELSGAIQTLQEMIKNQQPNLL